MADLILVRHGETLYNLKGVYYGSTDMELSPRGEDQAKRLAHLLKDEDISHIYTSPLARAHKTAKIINRFHNKELRIRDSIKELDFGQWEGLSHGEIEKGWPKEYKKWCHDWIYTPPPDGRCAHELYGDIKAFLKEAADTSSTKVVVTHHGCIRMMIAHLLGLGLEDCWRFRVDPGSLSRVKITKGYGVLTALNVT